MKGSRLIGSSGGVLGVDGVCKGKGVRFYCKGGNINELREF